MSKYIGDFLRKQTVKGDFNTKSLAQTAATLSGTPVIKVAKDGDIASAVATGVSLTVDKGSITGYNTFEIVTTNAFYEPGKNYSVIITTGTIGGLDHAGTVVREFSIENRVNTALSRYPNGLVYFNSGSGSTGTDLGTHGTPDNPVNSPADAMTLAAALGTKKIMVFNTFTVPSALEDYHLGTSEGGGIVNFNGQNIRYCHFEKLDLTGIIGSGSLSNKAYDCELYGTVEVFGVYRRCQLAYPNTVASINIKNGCTFMDCKGDTFDIDFVNADWTGAVDVLFANMAAKSITIENLAPTVNPGRLVLEVSGNPDITINASCTAGQIIIMGNVNSITDNSGAGCTVTTQTNLKAVQDKTDGLNFTGNNLHVDLRAIVGSANVDTKSLTEWSEILLGMASGNIAKDTPIAGQVTVYKQDGTTPLFIFTADETGRTIVP